MYITYELIGGSATESYEDFKNKVISSLQPRIDQDVAQMVKVTLTDSAPPTFSVIPFGKSRIAAIQTHWTNPDRVSRHLLTNDLIGSYAVSEEFPVRYDRTWAVGERTPGVCLLTLFRKRSDISYETFIERWHHGHTPLSLEIHPLWHYSRNVVGATLTEGSLPLDGIVEEHTRSRSELLNPLKFFGGPLKMLPNMIRTYADVRSFLDYPSITPYLTSEYYLKDSTTS